MKSRRVSGGVGNNQYKVGGWVKAQLAESLDIGGVSAVLIDDSGRRRCGEVWGTQCQAWVSPPKYAHDNHPSLTLRLVYSCRSDADLEVLAGLASSDDVGVRRAVAGNPNTSPKLLERLAGDDFFVVRIAVAEHPNASPELLERLAGDESKWVRRGVAKNSNISAEVLDTLAQDENVWVRGGVAGNPNTSPELLERLAVGNSALIRGAVAGNFNTLAVTLMKLAIDKHGAVREAAWENPSLPESVKAMIILSD